MSKRPYERHILLLALATGAPATTVALLLLWYGGYSAKLFWTLTTFLCVFWLMSAFALRRRIVTPLQTISNLLSAIREEDYSIRARGAGAQDALGQVFAEVNALSEVLHAQRLGALEATALLRTVMAEIDVAVFAFDTELRLRLINRAGAQLLNQPVERLIGLTAQELGLQNCFAQAGSDISRELTFPGKAGRWLVRSGTFREGGRPHMLLVISDMSRELREQELQAWQRLVRVLSHELNNSLAPIKSISESLKGILRVRGDEWQEDIEHGLGVIGARADALARFLQAYSKLAKLPPPRLERVELADLIKHVARLEPSVELVLETTVEVRADSDQLEQLLINLIRNAVEATGETGGVRVLLRESGRYAEISVEDDGSGLGGTANLFVPFFTTKPQGSGIGLVLSRQIAEAHGGSLQLENRPSGGCVATLRIPK